MSCGCNDTFSFNTMLNEAKNLETRTGKTHIVYIRKPDNKERFFIREKDEIDSIEGVKEYFLSDGTKELFPVKKKEVKKEIEPDPETKKEPENVEAKVSKTKK